MREKGQVFIYNSEELALLKTVFSDNDLLLYAIRKVLLQFPLSEPERGLIKLQVTPTVFAILKKRIYPELDPDSPLSQLADYRTLLTEDLKTKSPSEMEYLFKARLLEMAYLSQQLEVLRDITEAHEEPLKLQDMRSMAGKTVEDCFVGTKAYLDLLGYIDPMLLLIQNIAGAKEETPEQQKERMTRNSNK